jgi:hypothetical protein
MSRKETLLEHSLAFTSCSIFFFSLGQLMPDREKNRKKKKEEISTSYCSYCLFSSFFLCLLRTCKQKEMHVRFIEERKERQRIGTT